MGPSRDHLAEIDMLKNENFILNQRMAALEKIIGKAPSTQQDDKINPSSYVVNPIFEEGGDFTVHTVHHQEQNMRGRWYYVK